MKSSLSLSLVVVPDSEANAWSSVCPIGHGEGWSLRQEEMRRLRLARRALGRERREDGGVVPLLLVLVVDEEEVGWRVRSRGLGGYSLVMLIWEEWALGCWPAAW